MTTASGRSLAAYREEAKKCVLVCANCHGEIETGAITSPPPGARFGEEWSEMAVPSAESPEASDASTPVPTAPQLRLTIQFD